MAQQQTQPAAAVDVSDVTTPPDFPSYAIAVDPCTGTEILVRTNGSAGPQVTVLRTPRQLLEHFADVTGAEFCRLRKQRPSARPEVLLGEALERTMELIGAGYGTE